MLDWIFRKSGKAPTQAPAAAPHQPPPVTSPAAPSVDWPARLTQARGDDEALLALARAAGVPLAIKQAAVEALDGEAALAAAEREFRNHDRRVHQLAKRRLQAQVAQRQTREQAARLIDTARSLAAQPDMPANQGVELDRAWQALDSAAIEQPQRDAFAALTAQLAAQLRQRTDTEAQRKRWRDAALRSAQQLQAACAEAAAGTQDRAALAGTVDAARAVADALAPDDAAAPACAAALDALQQALFTAAALDSHLAVLDRLLAAEALPSAAAGDDAQQDLLALAPLPDAGLMALLQARHARWQDARAQARRAQQSERREQSRQQQRARQDEQGAALAQTVAQAETALDAGQLAEAQQLLGDIDDSAPGADVPDALRVRIAAAQARLAQLRGWQHWAGGRARDELVLQAEALAAATLGPDAAEGASEAQAEVARLSVRQRADVIATLRARWKEVDRLGGAGGRALWQRFDAALQAANAPVAAHAAAQRAARDSNLAQRLQLLDALEAVATADNVAPVDPPALATALDRFQAGWRKLGPLEHTVPRAAQAALVARMEAAVARADAPLQAARRQARTEREALVARAQALAADGPGRDLVGEVRSLQADWQQHAKALPLARADEQALWLRFKAAIDAAFAAREAVFNAREAEFEAHAAERTALIERLQLRPDDSPAAQRRTLAEVDAAWQRCSPAPRARAAALEAEFRAARAALRQWLDDSAQRAWQATCDALDAKLALCLAREQGAAEALQEPAAIAAAWQALTALPAPLEDALRQRAGLAPTSGADTAPASDELLLQIETAWDLPTPPAYAAARRERKLLAMKLALEGRRAGSAPEVLSPLAALALLLRRGATDAGQRERLAQVLAAWRRRGPQRGPGA